jgi:heptosyltransferase-1
VQLFDRRDRSSYLRVLRSLRRERYDAVVDDLGAAGAASLTRTLIMLATGAPHRIGVAGQENDYIYTIAVPPGPPGHTIETSAVVARAFGVEPRWTEWRPSVELSEGERATADAAWQRVADESGTEHARRLLVNVSATHAIRRWPDERFVALLRDARTRHPDLAVAVIGTPPERQRIEAIAREARVSVVHTASVRQAIALVAEADVVLTPDTSITHAATAFEIPVVVMLRPSMARFLPWRTPHRAVWVESESFSALPVEPVAEALDALLAETVRGAPA